MTSNAVPRRQWWRIAGPRLLPWRSFLGGSLLMLAAYFVGWHYLIPWLPPRYQELVALYPIRGVTASILVLLYASWFLLRRIRAAEAGEATWLTLFEAAPDAVLLVDLGGKIALVNAKAETMFGFDRARLADQSIDQLVPGFMKYGTGKVMEAKARRASGNWFPASVSIARAANSDLVIAFVRDITERRHAEQANARLAAIVENSDDAILSKSVDGTILTWNRGAERLYGYAAEEIVKKNVRVLIPETLADEEKTILERVSRGERIDHYVTKRRRKDGTLVRVALTVSPVRDAEGEIVALSAIARDLSEPTPLGPAAAIVRAEESPPADVPGLAEPKPSAVPASMTAATAAPATEAAAPRAQEA